MELPRADRPGRRPRGRDSSASRPPVCHLVHQLSTALTDTLNRAVASARSRPSINADTAGKRTASCASGDQVRASPTRSLTHRHECEPKVFRINSHAVGLRGLPLFPSGSAGSAPVHHPGPAQQHVRSQPSSAPSDVATSLHPPQDRKKVSTTIPSYAPPFYDMLTDTHTGSTSQIDEISDPDGQIDTTCQAGHISTLSENAKNRVSQFLLRLAQARELTASRTGRRKGDARAQPAEISCRYSRRIPSGDRFDQLAGSGSTIGGSFSSNQCRAHCATGCDGQVEDPGLILRAEG